MPIIVKPDDMPTKRSGDGWQEIALTGGDVTSDSAMVARRWSLQPNARGPRVSHSHDTEEFLYVIMGSGVALVGSERLPLEHETVLWLEPGDSYQLEAGEDGLEILQGYAPGE